MEEGASSRSRLTFYRCWSSSPDCNNAKVCHRSAPDQIHLERLPSWRQVLKLACMSVPLLISWCSKGMPLQASKAWEELDRSLQLNVLSGSSVSRTPLTQSSKTWRWPHQTNNIKLRWRQRNNRSTLPLSPSSSNSSTSRTLKASKSSVCAH